MCHRIRANPLCDQRSSSGDYRLVCQWAFTLLAVLGTPAWLEGADDAATARGAVATDVPTTILTFDELQADAVTGNALGRHSADTYRQKHGLWIGTCELSGTPAVGKTIHLTRPDATFEVVGGPGQPFISPQNILVASGGGTRDLLLTFEQPVTSVSIVSDRFIEPADVIRLMILEPIPSNDRAANIAAKTSPQAACRVLAFDRKLDNAKAAPGNVLSVHLKGKPFQHVLIECTTELEGFDDLRFTRAKQHDSPEKVAPSVIFDWKTIRDACQATQGLSPFTTLK